jgi:hypothetical protein
VRGATQRRVVRGRGRCRGVFCGKVAIFGKVVICGRVAIFGRVAFFGSVGIATA